MHRPRNKSSFKHIKTAASLVFCFTTLTMSSAYAMRFNGPIVIDNTYIQKHGNVISGNYQSTQTQPAIQITNAASPVFIINSNLQGPGDLIVITHSDVSVQNTTGIGTYPQLANTPKGKFISATNPINLYVSKCTVTDASYGIYVTGYAGNSSVGNAIKILNNNFSNIDGRPTDGNGGYITSGDFKAHAIQLNNVLSVPGVEIAWNSVINMPHVSASGELIELIDASGIATNHILVHDNYIQGAYPADPGSDTYTGGGIIANGTPTDSAATTSAFIDIYNNQVVSTANVGIAIAAGHDISVHDNRIISSGYLADGTFFPTNFANGMYNWNFYQQPSTVFFNNDMNNNTVGLINKDADGNPQRSDWYLPGQPSQESNINFQPYSSNSPTLGDEANEYVLWQNKVNNQNGTFRLATPSAPVTTSSLQK
jgi:hypothetical protein